MRSEERAEAGGGASDVKVGFRVILREPAIRTVMFIIFVVMLGFGILAPILPLYARSFGVGYDAAGLLIAAFAFTRLVFDLVAGPVVERFGERLSLAGGVAFVGFSSVLLGFAPTFPLAVVFRGIGGAGSSVMFAALFSYMLKVVPKDRMGRTLSVFFGSFNLGVIAGGPLGGVIAHWFGLRAPILFYAALLFLAGVLYLRFIQDPPRPPVDERDGDAPIRGVSGFFRVATGILRRPGFVTVVALNLAYLWMVSGVFDTLVPLYGGDGLGMSPLGIGAVFAVSIATEMAVLFHAGTLIDRLGRKPVLIPSGFALAVLIAAQGWAPTPIVFGVLMGLLGIASGYSGVVPPAMLSDVQPERHSATAIGIYRFFGDVGLMLAPAVAGLSIDGFGFKAAFAIAAVPLFVALVMAMRTRETMPPEIAAAAAAG